MSGAVCPGPRRRTAAVALTPACVLALLAAAHVPPRATDAERWRPAIHFTPPRGFMNDPNGLVYADGEYHLFYQHNPFGTRWGHMSWGHAVSRDLLHWRDLALALREEGGWMIFSGSAVAERGGTRLAAIYTAHTETRQAQHLAWSTDRGRTWTKDPANPVLDLGLKDFRDPKVFWHAPASEWIMAAAVPDRRQVRFFASKDLRAWETRGAFGPAGSTTGIWECPDLVRVPVEGGAPGERRDVLMVSVGDGAPAGGSGVQYFVGAFDGRSFTASSGSAVPSWVDYGPDFYAAQSWSNLPDAAGRAVWIGWMSNWRYANEEPSGLPERSISKPSDDQWRDVMTQVPPAGPWRGAMSIPRELVLRRTGDTWRLVQRPVREIDAIRASPTPDVRVDSSDKAATARGWISIAPAADLEVAISFESARAAGIVLDSARGEETRIGIDRVHRRVFVDRRRSGELAFSRTFASRDSGAVEVPRRADLRVLLDRSSVEVFADGGATVVTSRVFPSGAARELRTFIEGGHALVEVRGWRLEPVTGR